MPSYNKLVRDLIPDRIRAKGERPLTYELTKSEMGSQLVLKLAEEAREIQEALLSRDPSKLIQELGDHREVFITLKSYLKLSELPVVTESEDMSYDSLVLADRLIAWSGVISVRNREAAAVVLSTIARYFNRLCGALCIAPEEVEAARLEKRETHGGFDKRIFLQGVA